MEGVGTGGSVWPAAHVLARYLEKSGFAEKKTVLELGAGTGAAGLAAALCGATTVALTDLDSVLWLCQENAKSNVR